MATSRTPGSQGGNDYWHCSVMPPRTPGSLGINDQGDPGVWSLLGDTPGSLGINDHAAPTFDQRMEEQALTQRLLVLPSNHETIRGEDVDLIQAQNSPDVVLLASVAYGESSVKNIYEEMAAIATVILRQMDARGTTLQKLLSPNSSYAYAAGQTGAQRTPTFRKTSAAKRAKDPGMAIALRAAMNAINGGPDFSGGAFFWDGPDIKKHYAKHPKVLKGIKFTRPEHNIFQIKENKVDVKVYWQKLDKNGKMVDTTLRGAYQYAYESTAAIGGTIFWKFSAEYRAATGNKEYE